MADGPLPGEQPARPPDRPRHRREEGQVDPIVKEAVLWIRIRIQHFKWILIRIQDFDKQKYR